MKDLADWLTDIVDRPVVDKTGFPDAFDLDMKFDYERIRGSGDDSGLPAIYTALRDQLGVKLRNFIRHRSPVRT
jgi:uncharacterized protein (TIGR03435 family)